MLTLRSHLEYLAQLFNMNIIRVCCNTNSPYTSPYYSCVLKPNKLEKAFQRWTLGIFQTFEWTSYEPWGIYTYWVINKKFNRRYLWTEYNLFISYVYVRYTKSIYLKTPWFYSLTIISVQNHFNIWMWPIIKM